MLKSPVRFTKRSPAQIGDGSPQLGIGSGARTEVPSYPKDPLDRFGALTNYLGTVAYPYKDVGSDPNPTLAVTRISNKPSEHNILNTLPTIRVYQAPPPMGHDLRSMRRAARLVSRPILLPQAPQQ